MIQPGKGNLLECDAEALVNTVNCVGVMGKGIALQFKQAFPENFKFYERACRKDEVVPGKMLVFSTSKIMNPRFIINFPTKRHWKGRSRIEDIRHGLQDLVKIIKEHRISSIAVPPLGCGNGGLRWSNVEPLIKKAFEELPDVKVVLFAPHGTPESEVMPVGTNVPKMTRMKALIVKLIDIYGIEGYRQSQIEIQKLAYFLQASGVDMRLDFVRQQYGPYANNLNHLLQQCEGHYIRGFGDRVSNAQIHTTELGRNEADKLLESDSDAAERLAQVASLIEGFETPYGLELLSTVHWLADHKIEDAHKSHVGAIRGIKDWSERKANLFNSFHVKTAWNQLKEQGWISPSD